MPVFMNNTSNFEMDNQENDALKLAGAGDFFIMNPIFKNAQLERENEAGIEANENMRNKAQQYVLTQRTPISDLKSKGVTEESAPTVKEAAAIRSKLYVGNPGIYAAECNETQAALASVCCAEKPNCSASTSIPEWKQQLYCDGEIFGIYDAVTDDTVAAAKVLDGRLIVLRGSYFVPFADPNLPESAQRIRKMFMDVSYNNDCELDEDVDCRKAHPSAVASAIIGERSNGWEKWVDECGATLEARSKACFEER